MALESFLAPNESIRYTSPQMVEKDANWYYFYITDKRLIWHKQIGSIFKKDKFECQVLDKVTNISYQERGILPKKGYLLIHMGDRPPMEMKGSPELMKAIYREAQALIKIDEKEKQVVIEPVIQKETIIEKEVPKVVEEKPKRIKKIKNETPLKILEMRLAKGEIAEKQFLNLKADIEGKSKPSEKRAKKRN